MNNDGQNSDDQDLRRVEELMGPEPKKPNLADAEYAKNEPVVPDEGVVEAEEHDNDDEDGKEDNAVSTSPDDVEAAKPEEVITPGEPAPDATVDQAVDDIIEKEGDEVLEAEDAKLAKAFSGEKPGFKEKLKSFFAAWWRNRWARYGTLMAIILLLVGLAAWPTTRYAILNKAGVRASANFTVNDEKSGQPLKNVTVKIDEVSAKTGAEGTARLKKLTLGKHQLEISKPGFATIKKSLVLGWGSNPIPTYEMTATGSRFTFKVVDWLSGKPLKIGKEDAVSSKESDAKINDKGIAELAIEPTEADEIEVTVKVNGYRTEKIKVKVTSKEENVVKMVPSTPLVFISKRTGKLDIYKIDADGKNEKLLVKGTGSESQPSLVLHANPSGSTAALVSTRENITNNDGYVLQVLYLVNLSSGELSKVDQSERIQLVDWQGDNLVYIKVAQGASGANPKRHRLVSYDVEAETTKDLAASNYFNDVLVANGKIYYAPSNSFQENPTAFVYRINPDGTGKQTVLEGEAWNLYRSDSSTITLSVQQDWYIFDVNKDTKAKKTAKLASPPTNRLYVPGPSGSNKAVWVDTRDGKGVLLLDAADKKDQVLVTKSGLKYPVKWLNDHTVVFRVATPQETADYVLNIDGGEPVKVKDVSDIPGIGLWYYY